MHELMYYGGFTYFDAYHLPVNYRRFFLEQIRKDMTGKEDGDDDSTTPAPLDRSRAAHHNTPDARAWQGENRHHIPSRLIRFNNKG